MQVQHRRVTPGGVSLVSISAMRGVEGVVVRDPVITDDFARRRADSLDAEAAYTATGPSRRSRPWAPAIT